MGELIIPPLPREALWLSLIAIDKVAFKRARNITKIVQACAGWTCMTGDVLSEGVSHTCVTSGARRINSPQFDATNVII